ncbi:stage V sporulation protein AB [Clostridium sp. D2Q-14]|uniref:stage V sporulation protein AB n=1 Tax=Anaeromonas gelatinilytica TaxID=2683194 RepID=UPI00193C1F19|nr:stage V sporulation protein AB [Anaeromonas gelatinilytica]MBS4534270.1 stage V sporulation protein AB [Anaeromonas gelatinilytica]
MYKYFIFILIMFSGGMVVGTALASFFTLLDIIPRLAQKTDSSNFIVFYERILISSGILATVFDFFDISFLNIKILLIPIGVLLGAFIGLLAAALAEVLNVIPVLERKLKAGKLIQIPLLAISLGKVIGSLLQWLVFVKVK